MNDALMPFEKNAINMLANLSETYRSSLEEQLKTAKVRREHLVSAEIIIFDVDKNTKPLCLEYCVPVEIILDPKLTETRTILGKQEPIFLDISEDAIGILFHFRDGWLIELEIFSVSGKKLQLDMFHNDNAIYIINDKSLGDYSLP